MTVDELLAQCDAFKGRPVQLAGYLGECAGYECHLAADESHWDAFVGAFNNATRLQSHAERVRAPQADAQRRDAWSRAWAIPLVGVGGDQAFDRKAAPLQHHYVVITGAIATDSCTGKGQTDRGRGIEPIDIRAWTKSDGALGNTK